MGERSISHEDDWCHECLRMSDSPPRNRNRKKRMGTTKRAILVLTAVVTLLLGSTLAESLTDSFEAKKISSAPEKKVEVKPEVGDHGVVEVIEVVNANFGKCFAFLVKEHFREAIGNTLAIRTRHPFPDQELYQLLISQGNYVFRVN